MNYIILEYQYYNQTWGSRMGPCKRYHCPYADINVHH